MLGHVLGLVAVADVAQGQGVDRSLVEADELVEGAAVARPEALDALEVVVDPVVDLALGQDQTHRAAHKAWTPLGTSG